MISDACSETERWPLEPILVEAVKHVIMAMRMQFSFLGCNVVGRSLVTNRKKPANPETIDAILKSMTAGASS